MHTARKSLGQHFLTDDGVLQHIVRTLEISEQYRYVEIGPGKGALTQYVLPQVRELTVIEFDRAIIPLLEKNCAGLGELKIIHADVLTVNFAELAAEKELYVLGNLPYNISTPILFHLISYISLIQGMYFMLQEEVVDRIVATPHTKAYGRLSVMVQLYCEVEKIFSVPPQAFDPPPKVNSAMIRLTPYKNEQLAQVDVKKFSALVNIAFQQRRKTIRNSLSALLSVEKIKACGIDPEKRAENLSVDEYLLLAQSWEKGSSLDI